jgi:hypothetical protein
LGRILRGYKIDMDVYEIKPKEGDFVILKLLKVLGVFLCAYAAFFVLIFIGLPILTSRKGGASVFHLVTPDRLTEIVLYAALAATGYFIFPKIRHLQIEKFEFNDEVGKLRITYKSYFLNKRTRVLFFYTGLSFKSREAWDLANGTYDHIEFFSGTEKIGVIHGASVDWHKLPKTTQAIKEKILAINEQLSEV